MHKKQSVNKNNTTYHLKLVSGNPNSPRTQPPKPLATNTADPEEIKYLTLAIMNRLWIPQTTTIVGLLNVGAAKDNFQELTKWIDNQLNSATLGGASNNLQQLERRFLDVVSRYPEM